MGGACDLYFVCSRKAYVKSGNGSGNTTNLDLESLAILEAAMAAYKGTLIVVSHDETFLKKLGCGQELDLCHHKKTKRVDSEKDQ